VKHPQELRRAFENFAIQAEYYCRLRNDNHNAISRERKECDSLNIALKIKENSLSIAARWGTLLL
jgi:hypothetical protein